jgi:hypothetical protein
MRGRLRYAMERHFADDSPSSKGERPYEMTDKSESGAAPGDPSKPIKPPGPKRGAFPTPKSEIEKAKPYIPDIGEKDGPDEEDDPEGKLDLPTDIDGEREG